MRHALLPMITLALASSLAAPAGAQEPPKEPRILVTGEGEAAVRPDIALISLAVMREAPTARAALDDNSAAMAAVIAAMKADGIADTDLQTSGFSIQPRYVYPNNNDGTEQPRLVAYQVTNTLGVRVRDIAKVGGLLDRAVTLGVNQGGQISFTNDDPSAAMTQARKEAVEDAVARARTLAEAAGVTLGPVIEINESGALRSPEPMMAKSFDARAEAPAPVEAGENTYRVEVTVSFGIER